MKGTVVFGALSLAAFGISLVSLLMSGGTEASAQQATFPPIFWKQNGVDIFNANQGGVGIGTATPRARLDVSGDVAVNGNSVILWQEIETPLVHEFVYSGAQAFDVIVPGMPQGARYVLADVFVTASWGDQQNILLGRDVADQQNWVDPRGQQPSTVFGNVARHAVTITFPGQLDGYEPYYGSWYSSQVIPLKGDSSIGFNNFGNSGSDGWIYLVVRAFSL